MKATLGRALEFCARYGRWGLLIGLGAGLLLPDLAAFLQPWLPQMVATLLCITAFRVGYHDSAGRMKAEPRVLIEVLILQLLLPALGIALALTLGFSQHIAVLALLLMLAAPAISGSPNFALLVGRDPAPAMQVLVLGTALFPLTALPVFLFFDSIFEGIELGVGASFRMAIIILGAAGLGFALRATLLPAPSSVQFQRLDGLGVVALAVIVIGLMAGIGPLLASAPLTLIHWLAMAFAANFGLQLIAYGVLSKAADHRTVPLSIIAGNRNIALFLLALPSAAAEPLLPFIGCYQIPMYLTPLVFARLYRSTVA